MELTKDEIITAIKKGGKTPIKLLMYYYQDDIISGLPYEIILNRIENEFDIKLSYNSFGNAISRSRIKRKKEQELPIFSNVAQNNPPENIPKIEAKEIVKKQDIVTVDFTNERSLPTINRNLVMGTLD